MGINKLRVCYAVCYKDPNYIRTIALINVLKQIAGIDLIIIKNKKRGVLRYPEVFLKLLWVRLRRQPDIFIVGFRGHEAFWLFYPIIIGKKVIFDELVILHDWLVGEHKKLKENSLAIKLVDKYMHWIIKNSALVLSDTNAQAELSARINNAPLSKYAVIPVGADESTFFPAEFKKANQAPCLEVFFFGSMLPLHGMNFILEAVKHLKSEDKIKNIHITLAGGKSNLQAINLIKNFINKNLLEDNITYFEWIPARELPKYIAASDLCIGGPFGGTGQARRVITGKTYQFLSMSKATLIGRTNTDFAFIDKKNCLVVNQGSSREIAEALLWANNNRDKLVEIGKTGRDYYEKEFSVSAVAGKLKRVLEKLDNES